MKLRRTTGRMPARNSCTSSATRAALMALAMPLVMLLLFGYALTLDVDRIPTLVYDHDRTPESRDLIARFRARGISMSRARRTATRQSSTASTATVPAGGRHPARISRATCSRGRKREVQLILDGSDSNTASIAQGYAEALLQAYSHEVRAEALERRGGGGTEAARRAAAARLYNSELKSRNYIVPGLIAVILMIIAALLTSLTIAREWETGTMEQLLSTPVRPAELVLGKMLGLLRARLRRHGDRDRRRASLIFDVPLRGNVLLLVVTTLPVPVRGAVLGDLDLGRGALAVAGVPDGHAELVPAGVPALGICLLHREHARGDPGDHATSCRRATSSRCSRALPEGVGLERAVGGDRVSGRCTPPSCFVIATTQAAAEGGLNMWKRIREIVRKEFRQTLREPRMRVVLIGPPLIQLIIFGFAVNLDVDTRAHRAGWTWTARRRAASCGRLSRARADFDDCRGQPASEARRRMLLDHGRRAGRGARAAGLRAATSRGARRLRCRSWWTAPTRIPPSIVSSYAGAGRGALTRARRLQRQQRAKLVGRTVAAGGPVGLGVPRGGRAQTRVWFNPDLRSRNYFVPGVVVNIIALVTIMLTAMAIVREKEIGTMEQLMVTPIRPFELMLGKTLPFALVGLFRRVPDHRGGAAGLRNSVPREVVLLLFGCAAAVPADHAGRRAVHLHDLAHPAAGDDGFVLLLHAGVHAERLCVSRSATCRRRCSG